MPSSSEGFRQAQSKYTNATQAELRKDYDRAFALYYEAAQSFLHLARTNEGDEGLVARATAEARKAVERAEKIKAATDRKTAATPGSKKSGHELSPVARDQFSEQEQLVLISRSGTVNGITFPPWTRTAAQIVTDGNQEQPMMSPQQLSSGAVWRRPKDVLATVPLNPNLLLPQDIVQESVADCSVVASVAVCLNHHLRFGSSLGLSSLSPHGGGPEGFSKISDSGHYDFRFLINGTYRRITVDDKLPFSSNNKLICMHNINANPDLWPCLIEKAYLKVMGGYDFSGSNSSIDIRVMTGWIPEHINMHRPGFDQQKTWQRLKVAFDAGACVLTAGTTVHEQRLEQGTVLLPRHDYAITDLRQTDGERWVTLLNSFAHGHPGKEVILNVNWRELCMVFDGLYVNWDPRLFKHHQTLHSSWKSTADHRPSSHQTLRISITPDTRSGDLWVLLTRHTVSKDRTAEFMQLKVDLAEDSHIGYSGGASLEGAYTDSPHQLVRAQVLPNTKFASINVSYDGGYEDVRFTVDVYSSHPTLWIKEANRPSFVKPFEGALNTKTAGGNHTYPTYLLNPQYHLRIDPPGSALGASTFSNGLSSLVKVTCRVQGARDLPLHLSLFWSEGGQVFDAIEKDIAAHSGPYTHGFAQVSKELPAGSYTLVVSAFEPHNQGPFKLEIECSSRFDLDRISPEGAGMYSRIVSGRWDDTTAAGGPSFQHYYSNPSCKLSLSSPTQLRMRLQLTRLSTDAPLNVSLFPLDPSGGDASENEQGLSQPVLTSGPYTDATSGAVTPQALLQAGSYLAIMSTHRPGVKVDFVLMVYSDQPIEVELRLQR